MKKYIIYTWIDGALRISVKYATSLDYVVSGLKGDVVVVSDGKVIYSSKTAYP